MDRAPADAAWRAKAQADIRAPDALLAMSPSWGRGEAWRKAQTNTAGLPCEFGDGFHMVRLGKHIDKLQSMEAVAGLYQCRQIAA